MITGILMFFFGLLGSVKMRRLISADNYYTYSPPFTQHETTMLALFFLCFVLLLAGIILVVFSVMKKNNQDRLTHINNLQKEETTDRTCPSCGLNLLSDANSCPKCGWKNREE